MPTNPEFRCTTPQSAKLWAKNHKTECHNGHLWMFVYSPCEKGESTTEQGCQELVTEKGQTPFFKFWILLN